MEQHNQTIAIQTVIIWGASVSGQECHVRYQKQGIDTAYFVDKKAQPGDTLQGLPVRSIEYLLADKSQAYDAVILAMGADPSGPKQLLKDANINKPAISYRHGAEVVTQLARYLCPNLAYLGDNSEADQQTLRLLKDFITSSEKNILLDRSTAMISALLNYAPELAENIELLSPQTDLNSDTVLLITATRHLDITQAQQQLYRDYPGAKVISLYDVLASVPVETIAERLWIELPNSIYPIAIPEIKLQDDLDFALFDLPPRFYGMMPNGLGYVHNTLAQMDIKLQTMDLDILLYHRYHSSRILDGYDAITTSSGYTMKQEPWSVDVITEEWENQHVIDYFQLELDTLISEIARTKPRIMGFSLHGLNLKITDQVIKRIRQVHPEGIVLVGGYDCIRPEFGSNLFDDFDYMVVFEAEVSLPPLVKALLDGKRPRNQPGIVSKNDRPEFPFVPAPQLLDLDSVDFPKYQWVDVSLYQTFHGSQQTPLVLSRGCKWSRCTFCAERFNWRRRDPLKVVDEIQWMVDRGRHTFVFNDSDLSGDPQAVREICEEIIRRGINNISLSGQLRVQKGYTQEYFDILAQAGFNALTYGIDGWAKNTLKLHKKGYTVKMIDEVLKYTSNAGITISMNLVVGIPNETEADIDETIENIVASKKYIDSIGNLNTLILSNGSVYWERPEDFDIKFVGDKNQIMTDHIKMIPYEYWYSENPFIDQNIRLDRIKRIVEATIAAGISISSFSEWKLADRFQENKKVIG